MMPLHDLLAALDKRTTHGWRSREPEMHPELYVPESDDELLEAAEHYLSQLHRDTDTIQQPGGRVRDYVRYRTDWEPAHKNRRGRDDE